MNLMAYFLKTYWKSLLIFAMVLYLSFAPPSTFDGISIPAIPYLDKFIHFGMYAAWAAIICFDFFTQKKAAKSYTKFTIICILIPIITGGVVELIQERFFYPRTADWRDWLADILGVCFIQLIVAALKKKLKPTGT
jgi:VanZ family protein